MKKRFPAALLLLFMLLCGCHKKTGSPILPLESSMPPVSAAGTVYTPAPAASSTPQTTPSPSPLPTLAPVPTPPGLLGRRHEEKFTLEEICTDSSYTSPRQSLSWYMVEDRETFGKLVTYYVVDIWIRDVTLLRTAFAQDQFKARYIQDIEDISRQTGAIAALSGDFAVYRKKGLVIRNGEVLRKSLDSSRDVGVLYKDGTFACYEAGQVPLEDILSRDPWQSWCFGPSLLTADGSHKSRFHTTVAATNPRAAFGYYEPGHYCFVLVDGRSKKHSLGLTMEELSTLMESLGCCAAINLDGGATAQLSWNHALVNQPSGGGRRINDILYLAPEAQP